MSIHKIPEKYLNTTLHFFRESFELDDVGDLKKNAKELAYSSISGNVQASQRTGVNAHTEYTIGGRVYVQDHVAYINRIEDDVEREILPGDIMYDQETEIQYIVLGTEVWQSTRKSVTDSHHVKVILKALSGVPKDEAAVMITAESKANIVTEPPPAPLGINVSDSAPVVDVMG